MKYQFLFCSLLLFAFSCNKNVDDPQTFEEKVLGEWDIHSFVINSCPDPSNNVALVTSEDDGCLDMMGSFVCMTIHLLADGIAETRSSYEGIAEEYVETMTYTLDEENNLVKLCYDQNFLNDCLIYNLAGERLSNEMDEEGCICTFGFKKSES